MAHVTVDEVLHVLRDADFPVTKDKPIQAAQAAGASDEVLRALRALPPVEYRNGTEVRRSVPADLAAELGFTPGQRYKAIREAHRHHPQRFSAYSRDVPKPVVEAETGGD
jgi:Protein of unknown function (DUF2795)